MGLTAYRRCPVIGGLSSYGRWLLIGVSHVCEVSIYGRCQREVSAYGSCTQAEVSFLIAVFFSYCRDANIFNLKATKALNHLKKRNHSNEN